jgi:CBS domain-containing membrane protein
MVRPLTPVSELIEPLTSGRIHAVVVSDEEDRLLGVVTQTDLLAALVQRPGG